jgi:hypothetical protein
MATGSPIRLGLERQFDPKLVAELLAAHEECHRNFYLGGLRLSEVEGGRFSEAAFRMLECAAFGRFTAINSHLDSEDLIRRIAQLPGGSLPDAIRLHIPRCLRVVYDIRNNRDAAHLGDGIDPNLQDASLVISLIDWILAEFVRISHNVSAIDAQQMVEGIVTRRAPAIQDFDGYLKVLNPELSVSEYILLLLYQRGKAGANYSELEQWVRPSMRGNLRRTLLRLVDERAQVHFDGIQYLITLAGIRQVEERRLFDPEM